MYGQSRYRTLRRQGQLAVDELPVETVTFEQLAEMVDAPRAAGRQAERGRRPVATSLADVRDSFAAWLGPAFPPGRAHFLTGTYTDDYGTAHGMFTFGAVASDFRRFLRSAAPGSPFMLGVERHQYRDILHLHALVGADSGSHHLSDWWSAERGRATCVPVNDRGALYVVKYALKDEAAAAFDCYLP